MSLHVNRNNKTSKKGSWVVRWREHVNGKLLPRNLYLGSTADLSESQAQSHHDMILSIVGNVEQGMSLDRNQSAWLAKAPEKVHAKCVEYGLCRPRSIKRQKSEYSVESCVEVFMQQAAVSKGTKSVLEKAFGNLKKFLEGKKVTDVRDVTKTHGKDFRKWLLTNGREIGSGLLAESTVGKRVEKCSQLWNWLLEEEYVTRNVFAKAVGDTKPDKTRQTYVTLEQTQAMIDCQPTEQDKCIVVLARYMGMRAPSDMVMLKKSDVHWGSDPKTDPPTVTINSLKTGKRVCPLFPEARWAFEYLCERQEAAEGFLIQGERWDDVRRGTHETKDLSLSTRFKKRYEKAMGKECWPKLFNNMRASRITELIKIHGIDQHSVGEWVGNTPAIQNQHYLQIMQEDHAKAASVGYGLNTVTNTVTELANISESQVVSNDLYKRVLETTPAEELARNTLILEHLSTLMRSNKKASSLLKALLAESLQVAGAGFEKPVSNIVKHRVGKVKAVNTVTDTVTQVTTSSIYTESSSDWESVTDITEDWILESLAEAKKAARSQPA